MPTRVTFRLRPSSNRWTQSSRHWKDQKWTSPLMSCSAWRSSAAIGPSGGRSPLRGSISGSTAGRLHSGKGGGDVHYISTCGAGYVTRLALADIAGHGESVDGLAIALRKLMRKYINTLDQTRFARALNRELTADVEFGRFATAVLLTYFAPTRHLIICNAGHGRPLRYSGQTREMGIPRSEIRGRLPVAQSVASAVPPRATCQSAVGCFGAHGVRTARGGARRGRRRVAFHRRDHGSDGRLGTHAGGIRPSVARKRISPRRMSRNLANDSWLRSTGGAAKTLTPMIKR